MPPYSDNSKRSVYHVRNLEVFRLKQLTGSMDVFLSHDWPTGVWKHGDVDQLLKFKPHFRYVPIIFILVLFYVVVLVVEMIYNQVSWVVHHVKSCCWL